MTKALKMSAIVAIAVCWDILAHTMAPPLIYDNPSSIFVDKRLFVPIATLGLFLAFTALAVVFLRIQSAMSGPPLQKGIKFGIAFGGLWLIGILEMSLVFDSSPFVELCSGLADASAIVLLGVLLGRSFATASPRSTERWWPGVAAASPVVLSWLAVRYLGYLLALESACVTKPLLTLVWTTSAGLWIGVIYRLLRPRSPSRWSRWYFPLVVFGIDWAMFTAFVFLFVSGPTVVTVLGRIILDVVAVGIGTSAMEAAIAKRDRQLEVRHV